MSCSPRPTGPKSSIRRCCAPDGSTGKSWSTGRTRGDASEILAVHLKKVAKLGDDVKPEQIAALTPGFTGADLANLVNEATLLATRRNAEAVTMADFTAAIERMVAGLEKRNRLLNPLERRVVAYHELGHAMVTLALPGTDTVHKVSIIPRGVGALGYTIQRPTEDRYLMTRRRARAQDGGAARRPRRRAAGVSRGVDRCCGRSRPRRPTSPAPWFCATA